MIALENVRLFQELKESLEQQTATSEILGVIASSPTDIQPVLDAVAQNAARCVKRMTPRSRRSMAMSDEPRELWHHSGRFLPAAEKQTFESRFGWMAERSLTGKSSIFMICWRSSKRISGRSQVDEQWGVGHCLSTPLLREGDADRVDHDPPHGSAPVSLISRSALLETFADQAVIAIENVRLFKEIQRAQCGIARGAGASDGDGRGARYHQPLADGRAAGP